MNIFTEEKLKKLGIHEYSFIAPNEIDFKDEIQQICNNGACEMYGRTWACPPALGDAAECKKRCIEYSSALFFSAVYELEDSFDYEGMLDAGVKFRKLCDRVYEEAGADSTKILMLCNGACLRCEKCTYPNAPCRFPDKLFLSLEGHGILVSELAKAKGIKYINGKDTVTYFGMLLSK